MPGYFAIANVDAYDGSGWSFDRTFRPSGGVLPADTDPLLAKGITVTQQYHIDPGPLTSAPWMPALSRPQRVAGTAINIDPASGMIVPASGLTGNLNYSVQSTVVAHPLAGIDAARAFPDTAASNARPPSAISASLAALLSTFRAETNVGSSAGPLQFLQALQRDLRGHYTLSPAARGVAMGTLTPSPTPTTSAPSTAPRSTPRSAPRSTPRSGRHSSSRPDAHSTHHAHAAAVHRLAPAAGPHRSSGAKRSAGRGSGHPTGAGSSTPPSSSATPPSSSATPPSSSATPTPTPTPAGNGANAGGAGYSDVLASILGSHQGTPEQFATLVALLALDSGVPARVVTGFRVTSNGATMLQPGQYDVTTADAWTWVEVAVQGHGWMIVDPSPADYASSNPQSQSAAAAPSSSSAPPSKNALVTQSNGARGTTGPVKIAANRTASRESVLVGLLVALVLLALVIALILLTRKPARAARRRRAADPRLRLVGAWQESMDVLTEAGLPELRALTSAEIAALAQDRFGPESGHTTATLGAAANTVVYSPTTPIAADDADAAWREHRLLRRQVLGTLGLRDRVAARMRYHRPPRSRAPVSPPSWAAATAARSEQRRTAGRHRAEPGRRRAH